MRSTELFITLYNKIPVYIEIEQQKQQQNETFQGIKIYLFV